LTAGNLWVDKMSHMDFFQPLINHLKKKKKHNQKVVNKGDYESQKRFKKIFVKQA
jgi:hypothetical protein